MQITVNNLTTSQISMDVGIVPPMGNLTATIDDKNFYEVNAQLVALQAAGKITYNISSTQADSLTISTPTTLYVSTTGSDANFGTIDKPFKTIGAALNYVKRFEIRALATVNVGPGTFDGFYLGGFNFNQPNGTSGAGVGVSVEGTWTALDSGTATSVTGSNVLNDTTKNWSVDQFKGKFIEYTSAGGVSWTPIVTNSSTSITALLSAGATIIATSYRIVDFGTIISGNVKGFGTYGQFGLQAGTASYCMVGLGPNTRQQSVANIRVASIWFNGNCIIRQGLTMAAMFCKFTNTFSISTGGLALTNTLHEISTNSSCITIGAQGNTNAWVTTANSWLRQTGATFGIGINIPFTQSTGNVAVILASLFDNLAAAVFTTALGTIAQISNGSTFRGCTTILTATGFGAIVSIGTLNFATNLPIGGGSGNGTGLILTKGAKVQIDAASATGATTDITYDGVNATLATMRAASPKLLTNTYGTIVYE